VHGRRLLLRRNIRNGWKADVSVAAHQHAGIRHRQKDKPQTTDSDDCPDAPVHRVSITAGASVREGSKADNWRARVTGHRTPTLSAESKAARHFDAPSRLDTPTKSGRLFLTGGQNASGFFRFLSHIHSALTRVRRTAAVRLRHSHDGGGSFFTRGEPLPCPTLTDRHAGNCLVWGSWHVFR